MSIIGDVFGVGGITSLVQTIINKVVPDKAQQEQIALALQQNQAAIQEMQDNYETKLNDIAGQNIRADASSGDKFTQRARPLFMYMVEAILGFNYIGIPIAQMFGSHLTPMTLPPDLLVLFGTCVTGYVFNRTAEKISAMPGDSQINVAGILRASNKS